MRVADRVFGSLPLIRGWWWRHKVWSRLDIPAREWEQLDTMTEELADRLDNVRRLENLVINAHEARAAHGMSTSQTWTDVTGKEKSVTFVLDGSDASDTMIESFDKSLTQERRAMLELVSELSRWGMKNVVRTDYPDRAPALVSLGAFIKTVARIQIELGELRKGKTPDEFLKVALLDKERRAARIRIADVPEAVPLAEPVNLKKEPKPAEKKKPSSRKSAEQVKMASALPKAFRAAGIDLVFSNWIDGRSVTRYRLRRDPTQKLSGIENAASDVALSLGVKTVSITPATGEKNIVYVDIPKEKPEPLLYKTVPAKNGKIFIGEEVGGNLLYSDMEQLCHILIAGTTGSGKSTLLNCLICGFLRNGLKENRLVLIDPKQVEFTRYAKSPVLWRETVTDMEQVEETLEVVISEMERRYTKLTAYGVTKLSEYNEQAKEPMPRLIVIIDELSDLILSRGKYVEPLLVKLAQKGRAAGVHLILATQRPDAKVITGNIKTNMPTRIALKTTSGLESRIIFDHDGAERLNGNGDMLFLPQNGSPTRAQGAYITASDISDTVNAAN